MIPAIGTTDYGEPVMDHGPLPSSDENASLERKSIKALNALLKDTDSLLLRDERISDYGVDASLEVNLGGRVTNFRSQLQLKATAEFSRTADGVVYFDIETKNLNYLLNGPFPLYLIYESATGTFRYTWAHDELKRLEQGGLDWKRQKTVRIRFVTELDAAAVESVAERIQRQGEFVRRTNDILAAETMAHPIRYEVDPATLQVTDSRTAEQLVLDLGSHFVAAGYGKRVIDLIELVDEQRRSDPRIGFVRAYAEYSLGDYHAALVNIARIEILSADLSKEDRAFLADISNVCEYQLGRVDQPTFDRREQENEKMRTGAVRKHRELEHVRMKVLKERDKTIRASLESKVDQLAGEIIRDGSMPEALRIHARLVQLFNSLGIAIHSLFQEIVFNHARKKMGRGVESSSDDGFRRSAENVAQWMNDITALAHDAKSTMNPILTAEAVLLRALGSLFIQTNAYFVSIWNQRGYKLSDKVFMEILNDVDWAIGVFVASSNYEAEFRAKLCKADLYELYGRQDEAKKVAVPIERMAAAMGLVHARERASQLATGKSLLAAFRDEAEAFWTSDPDDRIGSSDDAALEEWARGVLRVGHYPPERLPVLIRDCESLRDIARERKSWCRHIQLLQDQRPLESAATAYAIDPNRKCICDHFGFETTTETPDWRRLISEFKSAFCSSCTSRAPKIGDTPAENA